MTPAILAREFSRVLRAALTTSEMELVLERNLTETSALVCHSHDFCDANMVMADAFKNVADRDVDLDSTDDTTLWNAAWEIAVSTEFDAGPFFKFSWHGTTIPPVIAGMSFASDDNGFEAADRANLEVLRLGEATPFNDDCAATRIA